MSQAGLTSVNDPLNLMIVCCRLYSCYILNDRIHWCFITRPIFLSLKKNVDSLHVSLTDRPKPTIRLSVCTCGVFSFVHFCHTFCHILNPECSFFAHFHNLLFFFAHFSWLMDQTSRKSRTVSASCTGKKNILTTYWHSMCQHLNCDKHVSLNNFTEAQVSLTECI